MADKQSATPSSNPHLAALPEADTAEASTPSVTPSVPVQKEEDSDSTQETNDLKDDAPSTTEAQQIEDAQQIEELAAAIEALHVEHLPPVPLPEYPDAHPDLLRIARLIQGGKCKRIICMCGAGISVSAGIPDFRTPGGCSMRVGIVGVDICKQGASTTTVATTVAIHNLYSQPIHNPAPYLAHNHTHRHWFVQSVGEIQAPCT